jgi:transposase
MWLINQLKPYFKTISVIREKNKLAFVATCRSFIRLPHSQSDCRCIGGH